MKKKSLLLALVLLLCLCMALPCMAASYAPISMNYGMDWGDGGMFLEDAIKFDAAYETNPHNGALLISMKPGSKITFLGNFGPKEFLDEGGVFFGTYTKSANGEIKIKGQGYTALGEGYGVITKKTTYTTQQLFKNGVDMIGFHSGGQEYLVVVDGSIPNSATATPNASPVLVNGEVVAFDAYTINGNNYFKLRDLAYILSGTPCQFEVKWDGTANAIRLLPGLPYTVQGGEMTGKGSGSKKAIYNESTIYVEDWVAPLTAYTIEGNNYFKLRDIGDQFGFTVGWDETLKTIAINTDPQE